MSHTDVTPRHSTRPFAVLLALTAAAGCSARDELPTDERLFDISEALDDAGLEAGLDEGDPPDSAPASTGPDTACEIERAPALVSVEPALVDQLVLPDQAIAFEIENRHDAPGRAILSVDVLYERGTRTFEAHHTATVAGGVGRTTTVELPIDGLDLPAAALAISGQLSVTTHIEYDDGTDAVVDGAARLYFHPTPRGLRVYDEQTRQTEFHGGALTPDIQRWAERNPGVRFGPAFIEKVSDDTSWRPPVDRADDWAPSISEAADHAHEASSLASAASHDATGPSHELTASRDPLASPTVKFCFKQKTQYIDAGNGEDFWTSSTNYPRNVAGTMMLVFRNGAFSYFGYLGDGVGAGDPGKGCVQGFAPGATFTFFAYSVASVQDNIITVSSATGQNTSSALPAQWAGAGGTYQITYDPVSAPFNVMAAASEAIYRHAGGLSGKTYDIEANSDKSAASYVYDGGTATLYIKDDDDGDGYGDETRKFVIAHEMGHAVGGQATGGRLVNNDCSNLDPVCPANGHNMTSKEYSACAIGEGFAHFYAADIWNSHYEDDCTFQLWNGASTTIDCELGSVAHPNAYMENECDPVYGGYGVELDWLRQFWDMHTEGGEPTMNQMLAWMDSADVWGATNGYGKLDAAANACGGAIDINWDARKAFNGVDH